MRFRNLKVMIQDHVRGIDPKYTNLEVYPGPVDPEIPTWYVLITPFSGPGLNTEDLFDARGFQVKAVGEQHDFDSAEDLAYIIDAFLRSLPTGTYQGERVTHFRRLGGNPDALLVDDANRTHFVCSYVVDVQSV